MAKIDELLEEFGSSVEQLVTTAIVNLDDGTPISGYSKDEDIDISAPIAYWSEVSRRGADASGATKMGELQEILVTTKTHFILLGTVPGSNYIHLTILTRKGNWGIAKITMQKFAPRFKEALP